MVNSPFAELLIFGPTKIKIPYLNPYFFLKFLFDSNFSCIPCHHRNVREQGGAVGGHGQARGGHLTDKWSKIAQCRRTGPQLALFEHVNCIAAHSA